MRQTLIRSAALLALLATTGAQAAETARPCLTRDEVRSVIAYAGPSMLESAVETCAAPLGRTATLTTRGPALVAEMRASQAAAWPAASAAIGKLTGAKAGGMAGLLAAMPEQSARPLVEGLISERLGAKIAPANCGDIERILQPLAPLPARNVVDLVTEIAIMVGREKKAVSICPAAA